MIINYNRIIDPFGVFLLKLIEDLDEMGFMRDDEENVVTKKFTVALTEDTPIVTDDRVVQLWANKTADDASTKYAELTVASDGLSTAFTLKDKDGNVLESMTLNADGTASIDGDLSVGNLVTDGTVDGRDVSADGDKLDGIESGATADQTDEEIETAYNNRVSVATDDQIKDTSDDTVYRYTPELINSAIKEQVDAAVASEMSYKGSYDADANEPNLDDNPDTGTISIGDMYTVTVAGEFYDVSVAIGDTLIAEVDDAGSIDDWTLVNRNIEEKASEIKVEASGNLTSTDVQAGLEELQSDIDTLESNKATKLQTSSTDTVYDDASTDTNYKLYIDNGDIILEEI